MKIKRSIDQKKLQEICDSKNKTCIIEKELIDPAAEIQNFRDLILRNPKIQFKVVDANFFTFYSLFCTKDILKNKLLPDNKFKLDS